MDKNELLRRIDGASLAYLGDCVFELWVREKLISGGMMGVGRLNEASHEYVTAKKQSAAFHKIEDILTEDEITVFKRGRNSPHLSVPKSASGAEYRTATGFEALCAYLWLEGEKERMYEILEKAFS
ncbi:MAG: Mini-ribonuclease 3 [Clostridia bacterium]|nr:Mini-ribonuclease 3 [Clostridia bacterium]MBQ6614416.1 Mini-ribonuclease 3 [Clostridia bacterium]